MVSDETRHRIASDTITQLLVYFAEEKPDDADVAGRCTFDEHGYETLIATIPGAGVLRIKVDFIPAAEVNDTLGPEYGVEAFKVPSDLSELDGA